MWTLSLLQSVTVKKKLFWVLFLFRVFFVWCNKVIFVLMFGTQYYLCLMFCARTEVFYEGQTHNAIFVAMYLCHWLCSLDVIVEMYMVFLYILVFALYVQNRKSFCHCRTQLRRCKSFKPCWSLADVKKNVFSLQASQRHDQDSWCRIFFVTTTLQQNCWENNLWRLHCLCYIFLCMRQFCF